MSGEITLQTVNSSVEALKTGLGTLNIAVEKLAEITVEGFNQVGARLDGVDNRLDRMELRQDQMAYRFELQALEQRVGIIEGKVK